MEKICDLCTGCRTCEKICPKHAIEMRENDEGFFYPFINQEKCVNCGLCQKKCPQNNNICSEGYIGKAYAAQINNESILLESSSGGFFSALAIEVLIKNGIIFGATMDANLKVFHRSIDKIEDLKLLRSSKYVASDVLDTYAETKKYLEDNKLVLYSGLPCQIAGLKTYLNKQYENLITVDVICHGTPSYKLFDVYRKGIEARRKSKISDYNFRDKTKRGWGIYWSYLYRNGKRQKNGGLNDDPYVSAFINGETYRESCYKCKYPGFHNRPADITLGDYWGIDIVHTEMASRNGVSAVIINTKSGKNIVENALKQCKYVETTKENIAKFNNSLIESSKRPQRRNNIYDGINTSEPIDFVKNNLKVSWKDFIKTKIRLMIPYSIRIRLKEL